MFGQTLATPVDDIENIAPLIQAYFKVNGFTIRCNDDCTAVAIADVAKAVKKTQQYIRQQTKAKKVADCLPDGKRVGRPSGLYDINDVIPVLEAGVRKGWDNASDLLEALS